MTHRAEEITSYDFRHSDELLFDTNVWLSVYGPPKLGPKRGAIYSQALQKILAARCRIYIDVLIVSEFINVCARFKWHLGFPQYRDFKQFRKSRDFGAISQDIADDVKQILQHCTRLESGFESLAIDILLDEYAAGNSDFNDQILANLCKSKGLKLVTDDADFKDCEISVVTANKRLLD